MVWNGKEQEYISEIRAMLPKINEKFEKLVNMENIAYMDNEYLFGFFDVRAFIGNALDELEDIEKFIEDFDRMCDLEDEAYDIEMESIMEEVEKNISIGEDGATIYTPEFKEKQGQ